MAMVKSLPPTSQVRPKFYPNNWVTDRVFLIWTQKKYQCNKKFIREHHQSEKFQLQNFFYIFIVSETWPIEIPYLQQ